MDRKPMLPAVEKFVAGMRDVCARIEGDGKWGRCRDLLAEMLKDPALQRHAGDWPVGGFDGKKVDNLLFYEDPDYGFVINGLIKNPGGLAVPHDHGQAWTVYGVLAGAERIVPPWRIHAEYAGDEKTIAVIVRSQRSGTFEQFRHNDDGSKTQFPGPNQVPYELA